ncbi:MAG: hypothetical protein WCQ63_02170 [Methanomethylophilus sp.]|nr:V-type ATP synthase subunit E family protein [Methanomethylophilus sp.]
MALDSVTKEITAAAEQTVAKLRDEQAKETAAIQAQADDQISEMKKNEEKKLAEGKKTLARQERSSAELESKKLVLSKKKEILSEAFDAALAALEGATDKQKLAWYKAMVKSAEEVIPDPKALVSPKEKITAAQLGVSEVVPDSQVQSGLILQSADGTVEVDMQFRTILQSVWDSNIKQLSAILFG